MSEHIYYGAYIRVEHVMIEYKQDSYKDCTQCTKQYDLKVKFCAEHGDTLSIVQKDFIKRKVNFNDVFGDDVFFEINFGKDNVEILISNQYQHYVLNDEPSQIEDNEYHLSPLEYVVSLRKDLYSELKVLDALVDKNQISNYQVKNGLLVYYY